MKSKAKPPSNTNPPSAIKPRLRLLQAADRLFYEEGIHSVGIDRVIAEAGVAKATLYSNFPSKDELILAVLEYREAQVVHFFTTAIQKHSKTSQNKIEAFFAAFKDWLELPDYRGCAFINATVELADKNHAGREYCRQQKARFRQMLQAMLADAISKTDDKLLASISLLVEGAIVTAQVDGSSEAAKIAKDAAMELIAMNAHQ